MAQEAAVQRPNLIHERTIDQGQEGSPGKRTQRLQNEFSAFTALDTKVAGERAMRKVHKMLGQTMGDIPAAFPENNLPDYERAVVAELYEHLSEPVDPKKDRTDFFSGLDDDELAALTEGLNRKGTDDIIGAHLERMSDDVLADFAINNGLLRQQLYDKDDVHALDRVRKDYEIQASDNQGKEKISHRPRAPRHLRGWRGRTAALAAVGVIGGVGGPLAVNAFTDNSSAPEYGYSSQSEQSHEVLVVQPQEVQKNFDDFKMLLHDSLHAQANDSLTQQFEMMQQGDLAKHFVSRAIVNNDGTRIGTQYNFWLSGNADQGSQADLIIKREEHQTGAYATTSFEANVGFDGQFVPNDSGIDLVSSQARQTAVERSFQLNGFEWRSPGGTENYNVADRIQPGTNLQAGVNVDETGRVFLYIQSPLDPGLDQQASPQAVTDNEKAAQLTDTVDRASRFLESVTDFEDVAKAQTVLDRAEAQASTIQDPSIQNDTDVIIDDEEAQIAGILATVATTPAQIDQLRALLDKIQDPTVRAEVNATIAQAALQRALAETAPDGTNTALNIADMIQKDPDLKDRVANAIGDDAEYDRLQTDPNQIHDTHELYDHIASEQTALSEQSAAAQSSITDKISSFFKNVYSKAIDK